MVDVVLDVGVSDVDVELDVVVEGVGMELVAPTGMVLLEVVGTAVTRVVVVVVAAQRPAAHASQQLAADPMQASPRFVAVHREGSGLTAHFVSPLRSVRQQVTEPDLPQVDFRAQRTMTCLQSFGRLPLFTARRATRATHFT